MLLTIKPVRLFTVSILFFTALTATPALAKEGVWIPATLKAHEKDMRREGLEIPVDQLYNDAGTGLNNAVVLFGKGCTGELISGKGLILTNHHCGYGSVQGLSSTENDYFANGFFAPNMEGEIPCKGLTVTFIRRMENVTDKILAGISDTMRDEQRDALVLQNITKTEKELTSELGYDRIWDCGLFKYELIVNPNHIL